MNILKYRGYYAFCSMDFEDGILIGEVLFVPEPMTFQALNPIELKQAFEKLIDEHISSFEQSGKKPYPPFRDADKYFTEEQLFHMVSSRKIKKITGQPSSPLTAIKDLIKGLPRLLAFHLEEFVFHNTKSFEYGKLADNAQGELKNLYRELCDHHINLMIESAKSTEHFPDFWRLVRKFRNREDSYYLKMARLTSAFEHFEIWAEDANALYVKIKPYWKLTGLADEIASSEREQDLKIAQELRQSRGMDMDRGYSYGRGMSR